MSGCTRIKKASDLVDKSIICRLPIDILHRIVELMPIKYVARTSILSKQWKQLWSTQPHLVFDASFFQCASSIRWSAAGIIHKILMQHTGPILGFHLISETHELSQSDVDECVIFVSNHSIQKLTLDMANIEKYALPSSIFTCAALTHLKLSRCIFRLLVDAQFPNLVSLKLEDSAFEKPVGPNAQFPKLMLPMLETLELKFCVDVDSVDIISPNLVNLSILSSYTVTFECFNVEPIFRKIKHLCLDGSSLKNLGSFPIPDMLNRSLNLQSLRICDLKISVKRIACALCLLRNSPDLVELDIDEVVKNLGSVPIPDMLDQSLNLQSLRIFDLKISVKRIACALCLLRNSPDLVELDIDEVVKVDETVCHTNELFDYLSEEEKEVNQALSKIRTVILRKFKGTTTEMYLIKVILAHSSKLERMIVDQCKKSHVPNVNQHLKELLSYPRASPNAEIKYS